MKGDANLSTIKATYFPPSIEPGFMGAHPPVKHGYGSMYESGNTSYFQNYRNENLAKFQMPPYEWGLTKTPYSPKPDLAAANHGKSNVTTLEDRKYTVASIDPVRQGEVDNFYRACQMHRDQYKDHSGKLHPLDYFQKFDFPYQCPTDPTSNYLKCPTRFVKYKDPIVFPKTLERTGRFPPLPHRNLVGRYNVEPDTSYKN